MPVKKHTKGLYKSLLRSIILGKILGKFKNMRYESRLFSTTKTPTQILKSEFFLFDSQEISSGLVWLQMIFEASQSWMTSIWDGSKQ